MPRLIAAEDIRKGDALTCVEVLSIIDGEPAFAVGVIRDGDRDYEVGPLGFAVRDYTKGDDVVATVATEKPIRIDPLAESLTSWNQTAKFVPASTIIGLRKATWGIIGPLED